MSGSYDVGHNRTRGSVSVIGRDASRRLLAGALAPLGWPPFLRGNPSPRAPQSRHLFPLLLLQEGRTTPYGTRRDRIESLSSLRISSAFSSLRRVGGSEVEELSDATGTPRAGTPPPFERRDRPRRDPFNEGRLPCGFYPFI